jgi:hypothetical protein
MMRNFSPFCAVCTRRILAVLDPFQPANTGPICDANGPYVAECSGATTEVQLDGGASSDFDCDTLSFDWSGPFAGGVVSGTMPTVLFSRTGVFDVALTVNDGDGDAAATCNAEVNVQDTSPPNLIAPPDVVAECTALGGTPVALGTPTVSDLCDAAVTVSNDAPAAFPVGNTLVTWTGVDDSGNSIQDTQTVTVADTTPPNLSVSVNPTLLWPPNHKLVQITANRRTTDICDPSPEITLLSIASNEPDDGSGDGATDADIQGAVFGTDDGDFQLRSERRGGGGGRKYLVTYQAIDDSGNTASVEVQVKVPAKSRKDAARRARFGLLDAL